MTTTNGIDIGAHYAAIFQEQTAAAIVNGFYIRRGEAIRTVGGRMVLDVSVYIDSIDKKFSRVNRIHYNSSEQVQKTLTALIAFAIWAGLDNLAASLSATRQALSDYHLVITSRAIYGGCGICVVTYLNRFEFRFDPHVAEQFQVFIGLYGSDFLRKAA